MEAILVEFVAECLLLCKLLDFVTMYDEEWSKTLYECNTVSCMYIYYVCVCVCVCMCAYLAIVLEERITKEEKEKRKRKRERKKKESGREREKRREGNRIKKENSEKKIAAGVSERKWILCVTTLLAIGPPSPSTDLYTVDMYHQGIIHSPFSRSLLERDTCMDPYHGSLLALFILGLS